MGLIAPWHVGSSWIRDWIHVPYIGRRILNHCTTREVPWEWCDFKLSVKGRPQGGGDKWFKTYLRRGMERRAFYTEGGAKWKPLGKSISDTVESLPLLLSRENQRRNSRRWWECREPQRPPWGCELFTQRGMGSHWKVWSEKQHETWKMILSNWKKEVAFGIIAVQHLSSLAYKETSQPDGQRLL